MELLVIFTLFSCFNFCRYCSNIVISCSFWCLRSIDLILIDHYLRLEFSFIVASYFESRLLFALRSVFIHWKSSRSFIELSFTIVIFFTSCCLDRSAKIFTVIFVIKQKGRLDLYFFFNKVLIVANFLWFFDLFVFVIVWLKFDWMVVVWIFDSLSSSMRRIDVVYVVLLLVIGRFVELIMHNPL